MYRASSEFLGARSESWNAVAGSGRDGVAARPGGAVLVHDESMDDGPASRAERQSLGQAVPADDPPGALAPRLRSHLRAAYGIRVTSMTELDDGVWLVARPDGPDWVARWFSPARPAEAVAGDAEILEFLAEHDFPAEQCADASPVSVLDGRA